MKLSSISKMIQSHAVIASGDANDMNMQGISIDTRTLQPGQLFIAIQGDNFDGHHFVSAAKEQGAAAAIVSQPVAVDIPQMVVEDTRVAFGQLAAAHRQQFNCPIVAITGSCGKSTVKEMTASILRQSHQVLSAERSYNNDIGVPLTLLTMNDQHDYVVIELGANHSGEIAQLVAYVQPKVAVITMIGSAHIEGFGSVQAIADAKGEIYSQLAADGVAIMPTDSEYVPQWRAQLSTQTVLTFGENEAADVYAQNIGLDEQGYAHFTLVLPEGQCTVNLPIQGRHNVHNAVAAASIASSLDCAIPDIQAGLAHFTPVEGRLTQKRGKCGAKIIDDTYNAIPQAVMAALDLLATLPGKRIFVFGDMRELGSAAQDYHRRIGEYAQRANLSYFMTLGEMSQWANKAYGGSNSAHFTDRAALIKQLNTYLDKDTVVLVKGSRGMRMEEVVAGIV